MNVSFKEYSEELKQFGDRRVVWDLAMPEAIALCGLLQLALRHPASRTSPSAALTRKFIQDFIESVPPEFPKIKELLRMGFHKKYDQ